MVRLSYTDANLEAALRKKRGLIDFITEDSVTSQLPQMLQGREPSLIGHFVSFRGSNNVITKPNNIITIPATVLNGRLTS
jgi:hypothetical protein